MMGPDVMTLTLTASGPAAVVRLHRSNYLALDSYRPALGGLSTLISTPFEHSLTLRTRSLTAAPILKSKERFGHSRIRFLGLCGCGAP